MWAIGVIVKTKDGTIVLAKLPDDAEVRVEGAKVTVTWGDGGKKAEIHVRPGTHKIVATTSGGIQVIGEEVEIAEGGHIVLTARLESIEKEPNAHPEPRPEEKQHKDLMIAGSVWKGILPRHVRFSHIHIGSILD